MDCQNFITELAERKKEKHIQREKRGAIQHLKQSVTRTEVLLERASAYQTYDNIKLTNI